MSDEGLPNFSKPQEWYDKDERDKKVKLLHRL